MQFTTSLLGADNTFHVDFLAQPAKFTRQVTLDKFDRPGLVLDTVRMNGNVETFECNTTVFGDTLE